MPKLFVMVGIVGSGKSVMAEKLAEENNCIIHASNELRKEMLGNASCQDSNEFIFQELHRRIACDLMDGKNVVFDATNISSKKRIAFLEGISRIICEKICVIMATPYEICQQNNRNYDRNTPEEVIERMYKSFQVPFMQEGWDDIRLIYSEQASELNYNYDEMLKDFMVFDQDNHNHTLTLGEHCVKTSELLKACTIDNELILAGLLHDCGKPFCKTYVKPNKEVTKEAHYYDHHNVGSYLSLFICKYHYDMCDMEILKVALLISMHMNFYMSWKDSKRVRRNSETLLGANIWSKLVLLNECDRLAH